jgi:thiamine transport system substrate-binding protein
MLGSCFRQVEFAGILDGTEHEEAAGQFIDFMLSRRFQEDVPLNMFVFPVRDGVTLPQVFVDFADIPDDPYELSPAEIGASRDEWIDEWTDIVLR